MNDMTAVSAWADSVGLILPKGTEVVWQPTMKQAEFLIAAAFEVLYGGAAGGGKTDGLLIDALGLQQDGWKNPDYQAIIFRRTFPDLKDIIDRSQDLYPKFAPGAKYDKQDHVWTFPGGGKVEFGYIQRDAERFRYRGRAFAYIGWEELTLWPTNKPYMYLMSRCRVPITSGLTTYVRATSNPDGPGYNWVKEHFKIATTGEATKFKVKVTDDVTGKEYERTRQFIPARVEDNPHISEDYIITLSLMDEEERNALRRGLWLPPKIKGAYYAKEMHDARNDERITKVPYVKSVPVNTFWDLGVSKNGTTAIWCHQHVNLQDRFLHCYEDHDKDLSFYVRYLRDLGYVFGVHYLPHDAEHKQLGKFTTDSWAEMLQELMPNDRIEIVERVENVGIGIEQTRGKLNQCVWDEEGCAEGIAALENHRREYDEEQQVHRNRPLHDWTSNYSDAFRQYGQCEDLVAVSKPFNRAKHRTTYRTA